MSAIGDAIKSKLSAPSMLKYYFGLALIVGALIFFATMRYNSDWAAKLLMNDIKTATDRQIAEKNASIERLNQQVTSLESVNGELGIKLYQLSNDLDKVKVAAAKRQAEIKGMKKSEVAKEFTEMGY